MEFERQPARPLARAVRGGDSAGTQGNPEVMTAALETPRVSVQSYDPLARVVHDYSSWQQVLREARLSRRELYVYYAGYEQPLLALPKVMEHIGDPGAPEEEREFEFVSVVRGLEAERTFTIYRYRNPEIDKRS